MSDLLAFLGFLLVLAGIADTILSSPFKQKVAAKISAPSAPGYNNLWINRFADKLLGNKLISVRAFVWTSVVSFLSLLIAFIMAGFPNTSVIADVIRSVFTNDGQGVYVLLICIFGCMIADFFSVAQTRLFARAIEKFNDRNISVILSISDVFFSMFVFVSIFSIFRMLCYVTLIILADPVAYTYSTVIFPTVIPKVVDKAPTLKKKLENLSPNDTANGDVNLLKATYLVGKKFDVLTSDQVVSTFKTTELNKGDLADIVKYTAEKGCFDGKNEPTSRSYDAYEAYSATHRILYSGVTDLQLEEKDFAKGSIKSFNDAFDQ